MSDDFQSLRILAKPKHDVLWIIRLNRAAPGDDPIWSYYYTAFGKEQKASYLVLIEPDIILLYCYAVDKEFREMRLGYSSFMSNFKDPDQEIQIRQATESDIRLLSEKKNQITIPWMKKFI